MSIKKILKNKLPKSIIAVFSAIKRTVFYKHYDSSEYWKNRAKCRGQSSVLWNNENYNNLYRKKQRFIISKYLDANEVSNVLDIGCGTGYVAKMMLAIKSDINIDAVDFSEMVQEAKNRNKDDNINYISSSAENYYDKTKKYDFCISSGCFSAIRNIEAMKKAINNVASMTGSNGTILMIDPFHQWNYLARVKFSSSEIEKHMKTLGFQLTDKSGVIFWPYRDKYANSTLSMDELSDRFEKGEKLLHFLGSHFWADYKILVFKKIND